MQGLAEPGLILTPPPNGTDNPRTLERDDGSLTTKQATLRGQDVPFIREKPEIGCLALF